ncbi:hypothetical protein BCR35DRAFT_330177 [Leucosporidium creatinivorum]|uniref:Uncharacterized protein n=1 Tax=Leucosporidium creatinivorum TaxID=106004 RepID=A0A1Y2FY90_9BASI|nr:hypothetical protein BCR35DRAFT_330177 [Leucosporidium creatinivorum]
MLPPSPSLPAPPTAPPASQRSPSPAASLTTTPTARPSFLPPSSSVSSPDTYTWPPDTRRITFTIYALPYPVHLLERLHAEQSRRTLDGRKQWLSEGEVETGMVIEVRRASVAGALMVLLEGEEAERLIYEAGAVRALEVFTPPSEEPISLDTLWLRSSRWWGLGFPYNLVTPLRLKFEHWLGEGEILWLNGWMEDALEEEEEACWWIQSTMAKKRHGGEWWKELVKRTRRAIRENEKENTRRCKKGVPRTFLS